MSSPTRRKGFTLAEVAVTIALIGLALAWMLQVLNASKLNAAYSRNLKLSRELALLTLGQIESGQFADDIDDERIEGTYAEEGYPDFSFEVVLGDENFRPDPTDQRAFDNWQYERDRREREKRAEDSSSASEGEDEEEDKAYEKIQIKVTFPKVQEMRNEYTLERWLPWRQLHPEEAAADEEAAAAESGSSSNQNNSGGTTGGNRTTGGRSGGTGTGTSGGTRK